MANDEWGTNGGGPGSDFVAKSATAVASLSVGLAAAQQKGGVLIKTLNDIMGPLALLQAGAVGLALRFGNVVRESERVRRGLEAIAKIQLYSNQFKALLGGLDSASKKLRDISKWADQSPFKFDDAVVGARNLQALTQGALATKAGLDLVGDAAAGCGEEFGSFSGMVGGLYDALQNGKPIGSTVGALVNLGVVSAGTARQVESLNASGASFSTTWRMVEADLAKSAGSMDQVSQQIAGLNNRIANVRERQDRNTGQSFQGGDQVRLEAELKTAEAMTPVLKSSGDVLGFFYAAWERAAGAVKVFAANLPGLRSGLASSIAAIGLITVALAGWGVTVAVAQVGQLVTGLLAWAATSATAATATGTLARAILWLGNATKIALGPMGWLTAAIGLVGFALADTVLESNDFSKAQKGLKDAANETTRALKEQIANIQSMADRSAALLKAYQSLAEAQERLRDAKLDRDRKANDINPFNDKPAQQAVADADANVGAMQAQVDAAKAVALDTLSMDQERLDLAKQRLEIERQVREAAAEAVIQNLTGAAKQQALEDRAAQKAAAARKADAEVAAFRADEYAVADPRQKLQSANADVMTQTSLVAKLKEDASKIPGGQQAAFQKNQELYAAQDALKAATASRDAAQKQIDDYAKNGAASERFRAQQTVEQLNRPGSTASGAERSAAQMNLDRAIQQNDPSRAAGEAADAAAAAKQNALDEAQRLADSKAGDQELALARQVAELRSEGVRRAREESDIRIKGLDQERARLLAQAAALKGGSAEQIAQSGASGKTPEQVNSELSKNSIQRRQELDERAQTDAEEQGRDRAALLDKQKEAINRQIATLRDPNGGSAKGIEKDIAVAALQTRANNLDIDDLQRKKAALATGDRGAIAAAGATGMRPGDIDNSIAAKATDNAGIASGLRDRREEADRTRRYARIESQASRLEGGGNNEAAARRRDSIKFEERILELRRDGLTIEESTKQARKEQRQDRVARRRGNNAGADGDSTVAEDFLPGGAGKRFRRGQTKAALAAIQSIPVDSMTGIGGNSGGNGGDGATSLLRAILDELRKNNRGGAQAAAVRTTTWDDNRQRTTTPY